MPVSSSPSIAISNRRQDFKTNARRLAIVAQVHLDKLGDIRQLGRVHTWVAWVASRWATQKARAPEE